MYPPRTEIGTQSLWISELTGVEESGQQALFIELLRSAICQRCKNNLLRVSNGHEADGGLLLKMNAKRASTKHTGDTQSERSVPVEVR
ncbi:MAG: hypothetical protein ACI97K_001236 [Glaciecola sp.]|jgi:hypothetical protein